MVVLDADSVMSGECLTRLVRLMEANPDAGIIQTAPRAAGRDTLFARVQQFASRVYGPLFTAGLHFWQLGESHYWGHNAIIRVEPFMRHCALGRLPGRGRFGGEILSHDFVEAALMRRAGWAVWLAYDLAGSYEEMPPNLLDELKRDRRWCQGNLINLRLFFAEGLHPAHRAVFLTGVMAYMSAPLWFLFLAAVDRAARRAHAGRPAVLRRAVPALSAVAGVASRRAIALFTRDRDAAVPAQDLASLLICVQRRASSFGGVLRLARQHARSRSCSRRCWRRCACCSTRSSCSRACSAGRCSGSRRRARTPRPAGAKRCAATGCTRCSASAGRRSCTG